MKLLTVCIPLFVILINCGFIEGNDKVDKLKIGIKKRVSKQLPTNGYVYKFIKSFFRPKVAQKLKKL